jgi:uncharacterized protein involved in exopolysaccharide biosynthesis
MFNEIEDTLSDLMDLARKYKWYILGIFGFGISYALYYIINAIIT